MNYKKKYNENYGDRLYDTDYDFSKEDFKIYVGANFNLSPSSEFVTNQTFRIVIIPSVLASTVNKTNYLEVMKAAKLSESQIKNIKL